MGTRTLLGPRTQKVGHPMVINHFTPGDQEASCLAVGTVDLVERDSEEYVTIFLSDGTYIILEQDEVDQIKALGRW